MLRIGRFHFDPSSRELASPDATRRLSPKASAVLSMLAEAHGLVCSRADIMDRVWPCVNVGEEVLTHAIAELRRAFSDDASAPRYVETVHKKGYRLKAEVVPALLGPNDASANFDLTAYGLCLEAQECFDRGGALNTSRAVELFSLAAEKSPRSALAHAGLAKALIFSSLYYDPDDRKLAGAEAHCAAALAAEPQCAEARLMAGMVRELQDGLPAAATDFGASLSLAPGSREAHFIVGRACYLGGEYKAAIGIFERAAALRTDDFYSLLTAGKLRLRLGDEIRARADFLLGARRVETFLTSYPDSYRALQCQANFLWHLGRKAEALALVDALCRHSDPMPYYTASFLALAGEHEQSLSLLSDTVDAGFRHGAFLEHDPDFDSVRTDSRFVRIARSVGVAA